MGAWQAFLLSLLEWVQSLGDKALWVAAGVKMGQGREDAETLDDVAKADVAASGVTGDSIDGLRDEWK